MFGAYPGSSEADNFLHLGNGIKFLADSFAMKFIFISLATDGFRDKSLPQKAGFFPTWDKRPVPGRQVPEKIQAEL